MHRVNFVQGEISYCQLFFMNSFTSVTTLTLCYMSKPLYNRSSDWQVAPVKERIERGQLQCRVAASFLSAPLAIIAFGGGTSAPLGPFAGYFWTGRLTFFVQLTLQVLWLVQIKRSHIRSIAL